MHNKTATRPSARLVPPADPVDPLLKAAVEAATSDHTVALFTPSPMSPYEFAIACEIFGIRRGEVLATMAEPRWYDLQVVAEHPGQQIASPHGFSVTVERGLDDLVAADTVIMPLCAKPSDAETMRAGWRMPVLPSDTVIDALRAAADRGARILSFCSGAFALAEAGLLDGRRATTHWMYIESFRARYPKVDVVPDVLYVDEGSVLTAAGSASGADLALHVVRQDHGADVADLVARRMVVPPHRDGGQAQFTTVPSVPCGGTPFAALLDWMMEHLDEPLEVSDLAERAAMSDRTFARRFREATGTTPHQWLTAQRVARARQLLETTDLGIEAVARRSGLGSAANLRSRLRSATGVSPSTYRRRFQRSTAGVG